MEKKSKFIVSENRELNDTTVIIVTENTEKNKEDSTNERYAKNQ